MDRIRNILVGVDGSTASEAAVRLAARIAKDRGLALNAVHVVRNDYAAEMQQLLPGGASRVNEQLIQVAREQVEPALANSDFDGKIDLRVVLGNPTREVINAAEDMNADLLVLGTHGESKKPGVGSVAIRCVRKAKTKVMLVPPDSSARYRKIVAAIDFSPLSPVVMEQAIRLARLDGGEVTALHVYEMPWERSRWGPPGTNIEGLEDEFRSMLHEKFRSELVPADAGAEVRFELTKDVDPGRGLVRFATEHGADVVVTGTTGRSMLGYMLLGTTAEKVMQSVGCAVLAVKLTGLAHQDAEIAAQDDTEGSDS